MDVQHCDLLAKEIEFYNRSKKQFVHNYVNRYLLIKGDKLIGNFQSHDLAVREGVRRFGAGPFLVRLSGEDTPMASNPVLSLGLPCQS